MTTPQISMAQLQGMLTDIDVPDADIRPYLVESAEESTPLNPVVKVNPARLEAGLLEGAMLLNSLNGVARWRRQQRYHRKISSWQGLRVVSEGDSWFQYPFLLDDVIDHLFEPYAIFSLDAAGDLLSDMVRQNELVTAVVQEQPDVVLLSGGGNDLLGGARLSRTLLRFEPGRAPQAYLGGAFEANLRQVMADYQFLVARLGAVAPRTRIVLHSYDHAIPAAGRWLGRPLASIGIADTRLQQHIVQCIVDRFHQDLSMLAARNANVRLVDCRGAVGVGHWHDELHPTSAGFRQVAGLFASAIAEATGTAAVQLHSLGPLAAVEAVALPTSPGAQAEALLETYSEPVLLREIGRRKMLADAGDAASGEPLMIYRTSVEGVFAQQLALGEQLADGALRSMPAPLRGADDGPPSAALGLLENTPEAFAGQVASTLSGYAGLPAPATALLAAVVAARCQRAAPASPRPSG